MTLDFGSVMVGWVLAAVMFATLFESVFGDMRDDA